MYPIPGECPVCHADLHVTQMACCHCGTEVRGQFEMDHLSQLLPEQRHFVEIFILCEGKLNCVQEELGISYPTVRSRLDEVIRTLKFKVQNAEIPFAGDAEPLFRQDILSRLSRQEISAEEALQLLAEAQ